MTRWFVPNVLSEDFCYLMLNPSIIFTIRLCCNRMLNRFVQNWDHPSHLNATSKSYLQMISSFEFHSNHLITCPPWKVLLQANKTWVKKRMQLHVIFSVCISYELLNFGSRGYYINCCEGFRFISIHLYTRNLNNTSSDYTQPPAG